MCVFYLLPHEIIKYCSQLGARRETCRGFKWVRFLLRALASCCKCEKSKVALGQCKRTVIPIYSARGPSFWYHASMRAWRGIKNIYTQHSLSSQGRTPELGAPPLHLETGSRSNACRQDDCILFLLEWHIASFMHQKCAPWLTFPPFFPKRERRACPASHALMHAQERAKGCCADRWKFMRGTVFIHSADAGVRNLQSHRKIACYRINFINWKQEQGIWKKYYYFQLLLIYKIWFFKIMTWRTKSKLICRYSL